MFKALITTSLIIVASLAFANQQTAFIGKYAIDSTQCEIADYHSLTRVMIDYRNVPVARNQKVPAFLLFAFGSENSSEGILYTENFEDKFTGADGKDLWTATFDSKGFHSVKHFVRYGSSTWPDLEMKESVSLLKTSSGLLIEKSHEILTGRRPTKKTETCNLISLANDSSELKFRPLFEAVKNPELAQLKTFPLDKNMDLDQATVEVSAVQISQGNPTISQLKEVLAVYGLGVFAPLDDIKVKPVTRTRKAAAVAKAALATVLKYAQEGDAAEYQSLFAFRDLLSQVIANAAGSTLKVYSVTWSESSNDGEGVLLIDSQNNEAVYVGSSYHE